MHGGIISGDVGDCLSNAKREGQRREMWAVFTVLGSRLRADRRAATAIEYALIGSLVAVAAMAGMIAFGISLELLFTNISDQIAQSVLHDAPVDPARCVEVDSNCPK